MNNYTQKEAMKEIRAYAKDLGLTFKVQPKLSTDLNVYYMFVTRSGGKRVLDNCTFWNAYHNSVLNDYLKTLVK